MHCLLSCHAGHSPRTANPHPRSCMQVCNNLPSTSCGNQGGQHGTQNLMQVTKTAVSTSISSQPLLSSHFYSKPIIHRRDPPGIRIWQCYYLIAILQTQCGCKLSCTTAPNLAGQLPGEHVQYTTVCLLTMEQLQVTFGRLHNEGKSCYCCSSCRTRVRMWH